MVSFLLSAMSLALYNWSPILLPKHYYFNFMMWKLRKLRVLGYFVQGYTVRFYLPPASSCSNTCKSSCSLWDLFWEFFKLIPRLFSIYNEGSCLPWGRCTLPSLTFLSLSCVSGDCLHHGFWKIRKFSAAKNLQLLGGSIASNDSKNAMRWSVLTLDIITFTGKLVLLFTPYQLKQTHG